MLTHMGVGGGLGLLSMLFIQNPLPIYQDYICMGLVGAALGLVLLGERPMGYLHYKDKGLCMLNFPS